MTTDKIMKHLEEKWLEKYPNGNFKIGDAEKFLVEETKTELQKQVEHVLDEKKYDDLQSARMVVKELKQKLKGVFERA